MSKLIICAIVVCFSCLSIRCNNTTSIENGYFKEKNKIYEIKDTIDLQGAEVDIPSGVTIKPDGGLIINGTLIGNNTKIVGDKPLFYRVSIKGRWLVPKISTNLFVDLNYENSLKDVLGLTSPEIENTVQIQEGKYVVTATSGGTVLRINSNTTLQLDGEICLTPNRLEQYYIILIKDANNVKIKGNGGVIGDKDAHLGSAGEWGMGIHIVNSRDVNISDITIKKCWGDCIYIGLESKKITIHNCLLDNARRQGISITSVNNVVVRNTIIKNISGTLPEYAIDIEPNRSQEVKKVLISNVHVSDCSGGFLLYGNAKGAKIDNVIIRNCSVSGVVKKFPFSCSSANDVTITGCVSESKVPSSLYAININKLKLKSNRFMATSQDMMKIEGCGEVIIGD